ncbi:hypothetical protein KA005_41270 [bacterium]|nr:hypothetical protein [bacterium]
MTYFTLSEYIKNLVPSGQPGPGDRWLKWLLSNLGNPNRCEQVHITPDPEKPGDFLEFPNDPGLSGFDLSDRKFVAVVCVSNFDPEIHNASDTDWWDYYTPLNKNGIIIFLCPDSMRR